MSSVHRTSSRETIPLIHQRFDRVFGMRLKYHYLALCAQKLMKIERGGCKGVSVTVFTRMWDSAICTVYQFTLCTSQPKRDSIQIPDVN
jgi:hypothetical protein